MILSLIYLLFYAVSGILISRYIFSSESYPKRIWLGLTLGLFGNIWLPSLFAFFFRFSYLSHALAAFMMAGLTVLSLLQKKKAPLVNAKDFKSLLPLLSLLPILIIGVCLFFTHILQPKPDGYYVGQTTYGDLAMHLGFISSMAEQGFFPPEYSIFPGHQVNYPFLCEVPSSSLLMFGANLRWAYLIPALYAYGLIILGVYFTLKKWLKRERRTCFATYLFFIGGGFGFVYFFDRLNGASTVGALIDETGYANNLSYLLNDFYVTPTNLPRIGLRWVNPIVDMIIPQRATLFGWAFLFACFYLLLHFAFENRRSTLAPLILFAGGLPLIHTHSFLSLGIISAVYCVQDLIRHFDRKRLSQWACYGVITVLLAAPQLFTFAFQQASESGMVRIHFNWANEVDSYLWFYIKNMGWLFILLPFSLLLLSKKDRQISIGFMAVWFISEIMVFQPNIYDNNKLLFAWFFCLCALSAKLLGSLSHRLACHYRCSSQEQISSLSLLGLITSVLAFVFFVPVFTHLTQGYLELPSYGIYTELFLLAFLIFLSILICKVHYTHEFDVLAFLLFSASSGIALYLTYRLLHESSRHTLIISFPLSLFLAVISLGVIFLFAYLKTSSGLSIASRSVSIHSSKTLLTFLLCCSLFLSGPMTIIREFNSSYMMFSSRDILAASYIKQNTDSHSIFLTDYSWHLNPVSVLTGRSIVCGPDLFLYYHGIDTSERKEDVIAMFESPEENKELFQKYSVAYVYIGSSERANFDIDLDFFYENGSVIYDQDGIQVVEMQINT